MSWDSPLTVYLSSRDLEKAYKERRWSIHQQLRSSTMQQLEYKKAGYDEALKVVDEKIAECQEQLQRVKAGATSFKLENREITTNPAAAQEMLNNEISRLKTGKKWLLRERQIYVWEIRRRKLKAVRLPVLKMRLSQGEAEARGLLNQMRECCRRLKGLCEDYVHTCNIIYNAAQEISYLSNENPQISVPSLDAKLLPLIQEVDRRLPAAE